MTDTTHSQKDMELVVDTILRVFHSGVSAFHICPTCTTRMLVAALLERERCELELSGDDMAEYVTSLLNEMNEARPDDETMH